MKKFVFIGLFLIQSAAANNTQKLQQALPGKSVLFPSSPSEHLNNIRKQLNLKELSINPILNDAAMLHIRYLENNLPNHIQQSKQPFFSGAFPVDRALLAGYHSKNVSENFMIGNDPTQSVISLMTGIYHRFSLLSQQYDEVGYARGNYDNRDLSIHLWLLGNSKLNNFCKKNTSDLIGKNEIYFYDICKNNELQITKNNYKKLIATSHLPYVYYPVGDNIPTQFSGEIPNPLPQCKITSSPVSVDFYDHSTPITLKRFQIFHGEKLLDDTILLTSKNDPNKILKQNQFALYSKQPFEFGTVYRVEFEYLEKNILKNIYWSFMTEIPAKPYFVFSHQNKYSIEAGKSYIVYFPPRNCMDLVNSVSVSAKEINIYKSINLKADNYNRFEIMINTNKKDTIKMETNDKRSGEFIIDPPKAVLEQYIDHSITELHTQ